MGIAYFLYYFGIFFTIFEEKKDDEMLSVECGRKAAPTASSPNVRHGFPCRYWLTQLIGMRRRRMMIYRVSFLTGTPPKNSKYKKVAFNESHLACIEVSTKVLLFS